MGHINLYVKEALHAELLKRAKLKGLLLKEYCEELLKRAVRSENEPESSDKGKRG